MATESEVVRHIQGITRRHLRLWVGRGWVTPIERAGNHNYSEIDIARLQLIRQLKIDMAVNNEAIPIVLSLIDQLHGLRYELRSLAQAVETQHDDIQRAILSAHDDRKYNRE